MSRRDQRHGEHMKCEQHAEELLPLQLDTERASVPVFDELALLQLQLKMSEQDATGAAAALMLLASVASQLPEQAAGANRERKARIVTPAPPLLPPSPSSSPSPPPPSPPPPPPPLLMGPNAFGGTNSSSSCGPFSSFGSIGSSTKVATGRMQEPGGKRVIQSWSKVELGALKRAVALHGRNWATVASSVGSKTDVQCRMKVAKEVAVGRMQERGGKRVIQSWSEVELGALKRAVALHGRDWAAVASSVGSKTSGQCMSKVANEVAAGRMQEPGGKRVLDSWSKIELGALKRAVALHGRDWVAVASIVGSKTRLQCRARSPRRSRQGECRSKSRRAACAW
jgi:hypothetical protein